MDERAKAALQTDMVVDITTTGRTSGEPRRIEIWAHDLDGQVVITGSPGRRSWYANMLADAQITFHLKRDIQADLPATARPVTDETERRTILTKLKSASRFGQRQAMDVEVWVEGSCLVVLTFPD